MSVLATAIYFLTSHISEVQYNNWGTGVWNSLLEISGTGNCSDSSDKNDEYYKACIKKDIDAYWVFDNFWDSSYWQTWYKGKLTNTSDKDKYLKFGSWEKFREVCTKGFDELMKKGDWNRLSNGLGLGSNDTAKFRDSDELSIGECFSTYHKNTEKQSNKK